MKLWRKDSVRAFSLTELLVIVVALILLAGLFLPALHRAKERAQRVRCSGQLALVGVAFKFWAGDNRDKYPMQISVSGTNGGVLEMATNGIVFPIFQVMSNELNTPEALVCPADTQRSPARNFTTDFNSSNISYFVGLDADETQAAMLLSGDRNITNGTPVRHGILELTTNRVAGWTHEIHNGKGNILLTDGSVQQIANPMMNRLSKDSGAATNRMLMP